MINCYNFCRIEQREGKRMKKIMNDAQHVVRDMLGGFYFEHKERVSYEIQHDIIYRKDIKEMQEEVVLISGGGSGHEPAHYGYVGKGMLTMAVNGKIFTPPNTEQILAAIRMIDKKKSILLIIKNFKAFGKLCF